MSLRSYTLASTSSFIILRMAAISSSRKENKKELALSAEDYMNRMAANVRQEKHVDLTGSYRKLGGAARGWYEEYQERGENYEEEVEVVYRVKINWIHLS